jgi:hypothetical protein
MSGVMTDNMRPKPQNSTPSDKVAQAREDRLKAALKANLAKRKTQARQRRASDTEPDQS